MASLAFVTKSLPALLEANNVQSRGALVCITAYKAPAYDLFVYATDDGGVTWSETPVSAFPAGQEPTVLSTTTGGTIFAGSEFGFSRTNDGGATWTHTDRTLGVEPNAYITTFLPCSNGATVVGYAPGQPFVWRFDDVGQSVETLPVSAGELFEIHDTGTRLVLLYRGNNNAGQIWTSSYTGTFSFAYTIPLFNPTQYANTVGIKIVSGGGVTLAQATDQGVGFARSVDGGVTWAASGAVSFGLGSFFYNENENAFYGRVTDSRVVKSVDGGLTWTDVGPYVWWPDGFIEAGGLLYSSKTLTSPEYVQYVPHTSENYGVTWTAHTTESMLRFYSKQDSGGVTYLVYGDASTYKEAVVLEPAGGAGTFDLPMLSVFGYQDPSNAGAFNLPGFTVSSTGRYDPRYVYALDHAGAASVAPTSSGLIAALAMSAASTASVVGVDALVAATAISSALAASVLASQTVAGATAISLVWLDVAHQELVPADVWAMNAETGGFTRYEGFDFNSYAKIGAAYYGCKEDGIYRLDGQTDAGAPIRAMVSFGKQNFGTSALKRITNAYVGVSGQGRLFLKVMGEGQEYTYAARSYDEAIQVQRFDTGKGLRVNWLEFELYNADGEDFDLASVEFAVVPLGRRI